MKVIRSVTNIILNLLIAASSVYAQKTGGLNKLNGGVADQGTGKPIAEITVVALSKTGNREIAGAKTDDKGYFTISDIQEKVIRVKFSGVGYRTQIIDSVSLDGMTKIGLIKLTSVAIEMPEIVIKSLKPMVDFQIDRKVINIDRVPGGNSGSITDALRNSGQVDVDPSTNKITVRGQEVKLQMDGHPFNMTGDALAQMPSSMIDEVEVILAPGAKESAETGEGGAYIVNIITKKNAMDNYNGSVSLSTSTNNRNYGTVNFGYKAGKFNIFGMFSGGAGKGSSRNNSERINYLSQNLHYETSAGKNSYNGDMEYSKLGFDYNYDDFNSFTIYGNYNRMNFDADGNSTSSIKNDSLEYQYNYNNLVNNNYVSKNLSFNGFYKRKFQTKGKELTVDALYTKLDNPTDNEMNVLYSYKPAAPARQNGLTDVKNNTFILKTDFVMPLGSGRFETGYSFTTRSRDNDYDVVNFSYLSNNWADSMGFSNQFKYTEDIHAVYVTCSQKYDKFEIKAGLRMENLHTRGEQITTNEEFTKNYLNLFPDINIAYKLSEMMPITFNAFRRVKYPPLYYVNPFKVYSGPNSFQAGNPKIQPYFLNSYSLNFFQMLNFYYVFSTGMFTSATSVVQDSISMSSFINLSKSKTYGIEATLPYYNSPTMPVHLPDFITMMNIRFEYRWNNKYGSYENEDLTYLTKYASLSANLGLKLWWDVNASIYFSYSPRINNPKTIDNESKYLGFYMNKSFFNQKLRVGLNFSDLLDSQKFGSKTYGTTYYSSSSFVSEKSRGVSISITYMFNDYKERRDRNIDDGRDGEKKSI